MPFVLVEMASVVVAVDVVGGVVEVVFLVAWQPKRKSRENRSGRMDLFFSKRKENKRIVRKSKGQ